MATLLDLARLSSAVYEGDNRPPAGWSVISTQEGNYGFKATAYAGGGETIVAFRGTNLTRANIGGSAGDLAADAMLGVGMNTSHFAQGEKFLKDLTPRGAVSITGHSLGGAMAQIVGNRARLPFATFNAPGVGVFSAMNPAATAVRLGGSVVSALAAPGQAWRDTKNFFYRVRGVNVRLRTDPVSMIGVHYGKVVTLPGTAYAAQHSIDTLVEVLADCATGSTTIDSYFS